VTLRPGGRAGGGRGGAKALACNEKVALAGVNRRVRPCCSTVPPLSIDGVEITSSVAAETVLASASRPATAMHATPRGMRRTYPSSKRAVNVERWPGRPSEAHGQQRHPPCLPP